MTTYVFPGQGSQARGMGADLFSQFPDYVQKTIDILGYSISALCINDPNNQLNNTAYTQPALYVVNALFYLQKREQIQKLPEYVAGHSLGEYNALFAAGVFDFETGLKLVQKRGALMSEASGGGMAAVVGLNESDIINVLKNNHLDDIDVANFNSYTQIVISGPSESIKAAEKNFIDAGAKLYIPLKVSGAFHSRYMKTAQDEFANFLSSFTFRAPSIPVIANISAQPYDHNNIVNNLANQITHPVKWTQTIEYLKNQGETQFDEVGPGKVLSGLIARIQKGQ